ncbi:DNA-directed RNA polymerase I subunit RPA43 isoform X2 [Clupea harengus]|uniref:DNA-directed RNA polymerase subunit n=1 Tax=Clupea harengus TaxID=7950 RepID=A0A6P3W1B9_CLUHA|nr:DNA-directed RNA polymerase I subunit RPA43 isoform X2 [Clupea harengus]
MANLQHEEDDPHHAKMSTEISTSTQSVPFENTYTAVKDEAAISCLIPTFAEACKLVNTPYSCLVLDTHRRHVALPPMYLKKKKTGIEEELNAELLKFSEKCKGVPVAYDNIKLVGQHGDIFDDQGYIHLNIEASFVVFKPNKGQKLEGVINKIGQTFVGCLVHGCFNASILKPREMTSEMWRDSGLVIGGSLEFEVVQLDADAAGVLLIRGRLHKTWYEEMLRLTDPGTDDATEEPFMPADNTATEAALDGVDGVQPEKKKKKKKDKSKDKEALEDSVVKDSQLNGSGNTELTRTDSDVNSNGHVEKKKKKKKKDKETSSQATEGVPASDSSGYLSDKGSKKRKESDEANDASLPDNLEKPKAKKKKIK